MNGKNIFTTIEYVTEKIKEAITGHKNDEQAHPNLSKQIEVLSNERGYLTSKYYVGDFDNVTQNGIYRYNSFASGTLNVPINTVGTVFVTTTDVAIIHLIQTDAGKTFKRVKNSNGWGKMFEIATTEKTDILVTPQPGYEVLYQKSYMINGITYLSVRVRKTDRTEFGIHQHSLFTIPHNVNRSALASTPYGDSNLELLGNSVVNTIAWNDRIAYAWVGSPGVYGIEVTGRLM